MAVWSVGSVGNPLDGRGVDKDKDAGDGRYRFCVHSAPSRDDVILYIMCIMISVGPKSKWSFLAGPYGPAKRQGDIY